MDKKITISLNGKKEKKDNKVTKTLNIESDLWEKFNILCEKNDDVNRTDCFNQLLKAGFLYLEEKEKIEETEEKNYKDKLEETREDIEHAITYFSGGFLETEYIVNNILELINLSDFKSNNQFIRCKKILKDSIYILYKLKKNEFTIKDIYLIITNPVGKGRSFINNLLKFPPKNEVESERHLDIAAFFLEVFYNDKKEINVYLEDVELLRYYLEELLRLDDSFDINIFNNEDIIIDEEINTGSLNISEIRELSKEDLVLIRDLNMTERTVSCLEDSGIKIVGDLKLLTKLDVMKIRNLGRKELEELISKMKDLGIEFLDSEEDDEIDIV